MKAVVSGTKRRWFLPAFIVLGVLCLVLIGSKLGPSADAQAQLQTGMEDGIMAIPVQVGRDSYGLAMVDTSEQTLWIYEINNRGPAYNRLRLLAARSWRYDRLLKQYNTAEPRPEQVRILLESLGGEIKELKKEKTRESNINFLELAEPNK